MTVEVNRRPPHALTGFVPATRQTSAASRPLEHVRNHIRPQDRPFFDLLLESVTLDQIAHDLGPGWTRSVVDYHWRCIRSSLGIETDGPSQVTRVVLIRMAYGLDPCFCGGSA